MEKENNFQDHNHFSFNYDPIQIKSMVNSSFKSNDIRGIYGSELNENLMYLIGSAIADYLSPNFFIIGMDMRKSSPSLKDALEKGLRDKGVNIIDIGLCDTPLFYFVSLHLHYPGAMITASHNPSIYNGIKLVKENAIPIGSLSGLSDIKQIVLNNKNFSKNKKGTILKKEFYNEYKNYVLSLVPLSHSSKKCKIVVDAGSGMEGLMFPIIAKNLPIKVIEKCFELDDSFPYHEANPLISENLHLLKKTVLEEHADFGVAFDADGDRIIFVDENGININPSIISAILIKYYFNNQEIVYNSVCSRIINDTAINCNTKAHKERVGHAFIKKKMKELNAVFGCEHSGHYFYKENGYADSGIITFLYILKIVLKSNIPFSVLIKPFNKYYQAEEESINLKNDNQFTIIVEKIKKDYANKNAKFDMLDGIRIDLPNRWISIRKSGTEPVIRLNAEAISIEILKKELTKIKSYFYTI